MAKSAAKTLIETPFPSPDRVAKKLNLPKHRVQRVEGMMGLIQKNKVISSKGSSKKNKVISSKDRSETARGMFVIKLNRQSKHFTSTESKAIAEWLAKYLPKARAGKLFLKRSGVGLEIGPAERQTIANRLAISFSKMASVKDIALEVRPLKRAQAHSIKEFVKKSE